MNPRYAAWVRSGKPDPFPVWIGAAMREAHKAGNDCVSSDRNKYYSQQNIRIVDHGAFTDWCDYFADNYCATKTPMLNHTYEVKETHHEKSSQSLPTETGRNHRVHG